MNEQDYERRLRALQEEQKNRIQSIHVSWLVGVWIGGMMLLGDADTAVALGGVWCSLGLALFVTIGFLVMRKSPAEPKRLPFGFRIERRTGEIAELTWAVACLAGTLFLLLYRELRHERAVAAMILGFLMFIWPAVWLNDRLEK